MTKEKMLKGLDEIPDDAEVLAYHVTIREEKGQSVKGGITANGVESLLHAGSVLNHVAQSLDMNLEDAADLMIAYYKIHRKTSERDTVKIDVDALAALLGGKRDDE